MVVDARFVRAAGRLEALPAIGERIGPLLA
jgi:hypothetical protein